MVRMTHLKWRPMQLVFRFLHEGTEDGLFDYLREYFWGQVREEADCVDQETMDEFLDFVFEVLAAAVSWLNACQGSLADM